MHEISSATDFSNMAVTLTFRIKPVAHKAVGNLSSSLDNHLPTLQMQTQSPDLPLSVEGLYDFLLKKSEDCMLLELDLQRQKVLS